MLKSIELSGFKSFADKTRMDFPEGISALVGPNGSGKSNIVDAIKWVIGEQSAKKLRASEMTDVIFNGSETRPPAGMAEVTLSFDNRKRFFAVETDVVQITRRVYRSGESDYLVNRQSSRLKNVRDLLSGTGLGIQAYSIIEQGRVEMLLQSSPAQRRGILEDAAGIARFNSQKQMTLRRLERVEQNLTRLSDIVSEVENQFRTAKSQAGKARLYRQYTARLQELRTESSLIEWRDKREKSARFQEEIDRFLADGNALDERIRDAESKLASHNSGVDEIDSRLREIESRLAAVRERIAAADSTVEFQLEQLEPLETEILDHGRGLLALNSRRGGAEEMLRKTEGELSEAKQSLHETAGIFAVQRTELERLTAETDRFDGRRTELDGLLRDLELARSRMEGDVRGLVSREKTVAAGRGKREKKLESIRAQMDEILARDNELQGEAEERSTEIQRLGVALDSWKAERTNLLDDLTARRSEIQDLHRQLDRTGERIDVLDELVRTRDGLSPGVKQVLEQARNPESPFRHVHGLVADLLRVNVEAAALIELALGPSAQYLVASPEKELFAHIERTRATFSGRAGFLWLDPNPNSARNNRKGIWEGRPGVLGRADRFVETDPEFAPLVRRLLGRTWIVENLSVAKSLYAESETPADFLTVTGEFLSNGALVVGPVTAVGGLITRRTELRSLIELRPELELHLAELQAKLAEGIGESERLDARIGEKETKLRNLQSELDSLRLKRTANQDRDKRTRSDFGQLGDELAELTAEGESLRRERESLEEKLADSAAQKTTLQAERTETENDFVRSSVVRDEAEKKATNLKIELAKCEERLDFLTVRRAQFVENQKERKKLLDDHNRRLTDLTSRRNQAEMTALAAESLLAALYSERESFAGELTDVRAERAGLVAARKKTESDLKKIRQEQSKNQDAVHRREIETGRLAQELATLTERMKEDYGIDLADEVTRRHAAGEGENDVDIPPTPEECRREIDSLRDKIARLGSVNLEAIETLETLETRYTKLFNEYNDILASRKMIQRIIEKINVDSQRLFEETFDAVKIYFRDIFQRLFGGGHADLVFEDPEHPMESGVDLVVRPPGKDPKSVMLLSGGEKTLTCVAFLLAIFRYRANPVCILDEVDAALDEGNVGRFTAVLQDFRTDTQFFIVTHSKKTMSAAQTMYGVTMEDSGVSKLIAVEFNDVGEDGEILKRPDAVHPAAASPASDTAPPPDFGVA